MQGMDLTSNSYTDKLDISVSGTTPTGGYLNYENSILKDGCLTMDEYKVTIENGEVTKTEKGSCESVSLTACDSPNFKPSPEEWFTFDASTNTITGFSDAWDGTTDITIPCQIGGVDVENIDNSAFSAKELTDVCVSDNVVTIGYSSFASNKIKTLKLGNSVNIIHSGSFVGNLIEELIIPNSVVTIESAFNGNKIKKLQLGKKVEKLDFAAFASNNLKTVEIPSSVKIINASAFAANQLEEVYVYGNDIEIAGASFFKNDISNPNLKIIYNNTGKSLDWGMIISGNNNSTEYNFETGTVINEFGNVEVKKTN